MIEEKLTVPVVEDEAVVCLDMVEALEEVGFIVREADNVAEAPLVLAAHPAILPFITEIDMPGSLTGLDLAALARRTPYLNGYHGGIRTFRHRNFETASRRPFHLKAVCVDRGCEQSLFHAGRGLEGSRHASIC